jgi:hypothetical protein
VGRPADRFVAAAVLGAFFLQHLSEWFVRGDGRIAPPRVWIGQAFHSLMIAGLLLMLKWDRLGTVLLLASTAGFFITIRELDMIPIGLINFAPVAFFCVFWFARKG